MIHPLATLFEQFLKEHVYLKNVTPKTIICCQVAFKDFAATFPTDEARTATHSDLQRFVIHLSDRGVRPVTCNTYIAAMKPFACGYTPRDTLPSG